MKGLIRELRWREVFRTAGLYVGLSWISQRDIERRFIKKHSLRSDIIFNRVQKLPRWADVAIVFIPAGNVNDFSESR